MRRRLTPGPIVAAPSGPNAWLSFVPRRGAAGFVPPWTGFESVAFVGNSFTQQFAVVPSMEHYVEAALDGAAVTMGPPPVLVDTISAGNDGYYPAMTLGGMCLYPAIDQRYGSGAAGTLDAIDAIVSEPAGTYDYVTLTSGFLQEDASVTPDTIGADNIYLQPVRDIISEIDSRLDPAPTCIVRMTHEGFRTNNETDLVDTENYIRRQVIGARQLESEGITVIPEHYVYSRLQYGAFGAGPTSYTDAVPAYSALTHPSSSQPGNANLGWLSRTQGATGSFPFNTHLNVIATIVAAWTWGYMMWGIDPRGDTTFDSPTGLPNPLDDFISPDGTLIYGGHATGVGNVPFELETNPDGPPDSDFVLAWNATVRGQMQDRIVAAIDDWRAGTTEFD